MAGILTHRYSDRPVTLSSTEDVCGTASMISPTDVGEPKCTAETLLTRHFVSLHALLFRSPFDTINPNRYLSLLSLARKRALGLTPGHTCVLRSLRSVELYALQLASKDSHTVHRSSACTLVSPSPP